MANEKSILGERRNFLEGGHKILQGVDKFLRLDYPGLRPEANPEDELAQVTYPAIDPFVAENPYKKIRLLDLPQEKNPEYEITQQPKKSEKMDKVKSYDMMAGYPAFPTAVFEGAAKTAGKVAGTQAQKASEAAGASKEQLEKFGTLIDSQLTLQNNIYTDWLNSNQAAQKGIDEIQSRYPVLTRADIISNMSTGEKVLTGVLTMLGAAFTGKGEENPALKALNRTLDESIAQQSITYDREMKDLMNKKLINDDTFKMSVSQAQSNFQMQSNNLETALKIIDLSRSQYSKGEIQDIEDNAANEIRLQYSTAKMNYDLQVYGIKKQMDMFMAKLELERGRRAFPIQYARLNSDKDAVFSETNTRFLDPSIDKEKFQQNYSQRVSKIKSLQGIITTVKKNPSRGSLNVLVQSHNKIFGDDLPEPHLGTEDIRGSVEQLQSLLQVDIDGLNDLIDQSVIPWSKG